MKFSVTNDTITVVIDGNVETIHSDMPMFNDVREALFYGKFDKIPDLISPAKAINNWSLGNFKVHNGVVCYGPKLEPLPENLNHRILQMVKDNSSPIALTNFWEKLQKNPSHRSVEQLFTFLLHEGIPITNDGDILAYKSIQKDYTDWHTGTCINKVGTINEMPRNKISDDPNHACHFGFHVGSLAYVNNFHTDSLIMICKVDPADVVCVPYDADSQKVRVCKYEVIGHYGDKLPSTVFEEESDDDVLNSEDEDFEEVNDEEIFGFEDDLDEDEDNELDDEDDESLDEDEIAESLEKAGWQNAIMVEQKKEEKWYNFDNLSGKELLKQSLADLRLYARHSLDIVGASRIIGGKVALIKRILQVRKS